MNDDAPQFALTFTYTNWRGETALRTIDAHSAYFRFAATEWHPEPQALLTAIDLEKNAPRDFAVKDIVGFGEAPIVAAAIADARARTRAHSGHLVTELAARHPWKDWPDARKALSVAARTVTKGHLAPPAEAQAPVVRETVE